MLIKCVMHMCMSRAFHTEHRCCAALEILDMPDSVVFNHEDIRSNANLFLGGRVPGQLHFTAASSVAASSSTSRCGAFRAVVFTK